MKKCFAILLAMLLLIAGSVSAEGYQAGVYTGSAQGFGGQLEVSVTVNDAAITAVVVTNQNETEAVGGAAIATLAQQVMDKQSAEIDGVAGATVTSEAVRGAVASALKKANGAAEKAELKAGTYTASAKGFQGGVTVEVEVSDSAIMAVRVTDVSDHPDTVTEKPVADIPAAIVANQSVNVDGVSGATFTSNAIRTAVADCLAQAGAGEMFNAPVEKASAEAIADAEVDVLVIGAGGAGIMAAVAASTKEDMTDSGLSVMLAEKQGFLGGSTGVAGGGYIQYLPEDGVVTEEWLDATVESEVAALTAYNDIEVNKGVLRSEIAVMPRSVAIKTGIGLVGEATSFILPNEETFHDHDHWYGQNLTKAATKYFETSPVDVRLNTRAVFLVADENNAVTGAVLETNGVSYTVTAKKVILACGGFAASPEMIAKYAPDYVGTLAFCMGANTGDGLQMAADIGAAVIGDSMLGYIGPAANIGMWEDYSANFQYNTAAGIVTQRLHLNADGERYCSESTPCNVEYAMILKQPGQVTYGIVDSDNLSVSVLQESQSEYLYRADTLAELAEKIGMSADKLEATVARYNGFVASGKDEDFGAPVEVMDAIEAAPFYAYVNRPIALSSLVSLDVNERCEVLDVNGKVIGNLYAAGDMMFGGAYCRYYVGARGIGTALHTGTLSGEEAKKAIAE